MLVDGRELGHLDREAEQLGAGVLEVPITRASVGGVVLERVGPGAGANDSAAAEQAS